MLLLSYGLSRKVFPDTYVSCAVRAEQFGDWTSHSFVDFDEYGASRFKVALGKFGDGLIEDQGVGVGYEKGQGGFGARHMGGHGRSVRPAEYRVDC